MKTFEERFKEVYPRINAISDRFARTSVVPSEEYESYLCEEFIKVDAAYNPKVNNSYAAFVGAMLETKAKTLASDKGKMRQFYDSIKPLDMPDDYDEEAKYPLELIADVDIEEQVFDVMFVEEQLRNAKDDKTRVVLEAFFEDPHASFREISRITGIPVMTVIRRLERVAGEVRAS